MKVTQDEIADRQAVLNIEVDTEALEEHMQRAYRRLVGRVNIPGFRKGKAPRPVFERAFGRERLVEEALESMVPEVVAKAVEESDLEAGGTPQVSVLERDPVPKIKATVPLTPRITLGDYSSLSFDDQPEEVTEDQVDRVLEQLRESQATWAPAERAIEAGDMAVLESVEGAAAGKSIVSSQGVEYEVLQDATRPVPGFATELLGLEAGESKEFSLILPDDFPDEAVTGETATFEVKISEVKRKVVPDLDDEFAQGVGEGYESLEELRRSIRSDIEARAAEAHRRQMEDKILDAIVEMSTIEVAPITVEHEAEHVINERQQSLARYNLSLEDYMQHAGKSENDIVSEAKEAALIRLQRALALEELGKVEGVEITEEQVDERIRELKDSATRPDERAQYETDQARGQIRASLRQQETLRRVMGKVQPEWGDAAFTQPEQEVEGASIDAADASPPQKAVESPEAAEATEPEDSGFPRSENSESKPRTSSARE